MQRQDAPSYNSVRQQRMVVEGHDDEGANGVDGCSKFQMGQIQTRARIQGTPMHWR